MTRAGFFRRAIALAIDLLFVAVILLAVLVAQFVSGRLENGPKVQRVAGGILACVVLLYSSTEVLLAATPGKMMLGMRIGSSLGFPADGWIRFLRWSTKQGPWILMGVYAVLPHPVFWFVGGYMNLFILCGVLAAANDDHLAWHDQWAGSAVWNVAKRQAESSLAAGGAL